MSSAYLYSALSGIYSEALFALACYDVKCHCERICSYFSETKHSKLKQSPAVGPRTRVEPTNGFPPTDDSSAVNMVRSLGVSRIRSQKFSIPVDKISDFPAIFPDFPGKNSDDFF